MRASVQWCLSKFNGVVASCIPDYWGYNYSQHRAYYSCLICGKRFVSSALGAVISCLTDSGERLVNCKILPF